MFFLENLSLLFFYFCKHCIVMAIDEMLQIALAITKVLSEFVLAYIRNIPKKFDLQIPVTCISRVRPM